MTPAHLPTSLDYYSLSYSEIMSIGQSIHVLMMAQILCTWLQNKLLTHEPAGIIMVVVEITVYIYSVPPGYNLSTGQSSISFQEHHHHRINKHNIATNNCGTPFAGWLLNSEE